MVPVDVHKLMIRTQAVKLLIVDMEWSQLVEDQRHLYTGLLDISSIVTRGGLLKGGPANGPSFPPLSASARFAPSW